MITFPKAEKYLELNERKESYNVLLLKIVDSDSTDAQIRIAAAIAFKNSVKRNWRIVSQISLVPAEEFGAHFHIH